MSDMDTYRLTSAINRLTEAVNAQNKLIEQMGTMLAQFMNYQIQKDQKQEKTEVSE